MTVSRCAAFFGSAALTVLLALSCVGWVVPPPLEQLVAERMARSRWSTSSSGMLPECSGC